MWKYCVNNVKLNLSEVMCTINLEGLNSVEYTDRSFIRTYIVLIVSEFLITCQASGGGGATNSLSYVHNMGVSHS